MSHKFFIWHFNDDSSFRKTMAEFLKLNGDEKNLFSCNHPVGRGKDQFLLPGVYLKSLTFADIVSKTQEKK
jgi:hypothetical protein